MTIAAGLPAFTVVGLPDKAVAESRERVRAALAALGLALPPRRITVNLAPADVLKEGSHFDLPIALGLLAAMEVLPADELDGYTALGELALDGSLTAGRRACCSAALAAAAREQRPHLPGRLRRRGGLGRRGRDRRGAEPPGASSTISRARSCCRRPSRSSPPPRAAGLDLKDVKGQESAKRALEIAAAGGHNLLMIGPPGSGKSMLAARLPGILPPLEPAEALELGMIQSVAGGLRGGGLLRERPFRDPHHSASLPALVGGGMRARPGEIVLAHQGVLFLDELPEFSRAALEALRQPLETGRVSVARANGHVTYPARVQLVAAMNPCRCGYLAEPGRACGRAPRCAQDYQSRISGPLFDRIDLHIDVPAVSPADLALPPPAEASAEVARRVAAARARQSARYAALAGRPPHPHQCRGRWRAARRDRDARAGRPRPADARRRAAAPVGARLSPRAARRPHPGRSRRRRHRRPPPHRRGAQLPPPAPAPGRSPPP